MCRLCLLPLIGSLLVSLVSTAAAQTPTCDRLAGPRETLATELLESQRPWDCCKDSIARCLKQKPTCALAFRLAENVCRRVAAGQPEERIVDALWQRYRSMLLGRGKAKIDLTGLPVAGDPNAPVTFVEYACPRCPFCAQSTPELYDAVVKGPLKGKVKMYFRTFPIRGHRDVKESSLAFLAAAKLGHFWEFVLYFYRRFDLFSVEKQLEWAEALGMDRQAFKQAMTDPAAEKALIDAKKEGIINNVNATPTYFIDGRKYRGELDHDELVDVLEEEFERVTGVRHLK